MIKREFWEEVAEVWAKKDEIEIPTFEGIVDVPDDVIDLDQVEDLNDMMEELFGSDFSYESILSK